MTTTSEELQELQEHAEEAKRDRSLAPVSLTMAVLAVLVATVSLLGHRAHTEEVILQNKATDQWAYYQAKNIRRHTEELFLDTLSLSAATAPQQTAKLQQKYAQDIDRYRNDQKDIEDKARDLEKEVVFERNRADRFDLGEVFLEMGLVITSITLLTRRRWYQFGLRTMMLLVTAWRAPRRESRRQREWLLAAAAAVLVCVACTLPWMAARAFYRAGLMDAVRINLR